MKFFNFDFDIAAIIIYLVVLISYLQKKHVSNSQHKIFYALFAVSFITPILDIPASILIDYECSWLSVVTVNTLYYLSKEGTTFFFLLYVMSQMESVKNISISKKLALAIPIFLVVMIIIINPITGWLFTYKATYNEGLLHRFWGRGPLRPVSYLVYIFYFFWSAVYVIQNRKIFNKSFRYLTYAICAVNVIAEILQFFCSALLVHSLAFSISMLLLLINNERYAMTVDPLTGMAKKENLETFCLKKIHNNQPFQIMMVRMADYDVNTGNFGVETIEQLVRQQEKLLLSYAGIGNTFKINNDCFALLFNASAGYQGIQEMLYDELRKPVLINNIEVSSEFYIATLSYPDNVNDMETLMTYLQYFEKMELTRYGIVQFKDFQLKDRVREQKVERAIENGLRDGNFEVYYQPICTAQDQKFVTAEALIRLTDPELGKLSPEEFIPIAEQNGSILKIGNFVLESVCRFIHNHNMEELGLEYIELNLSTVQCLQRNFIETIDEVTREYNIDSKYLCFEITETASNLAPSVFSQNLKMLNERGYVLALDDFGTGYGNLQRMVNSEFGIVKFDKQMTQQLSRGEQLQKVYKTLQAMIHTMGSKVVSEGVETKEQYEFIRDAGGTYIQGFYFSRPLPEDEFICFLLERRA